MKKNISIALISMISLALNSCSMKTPLDRIAEYPQLYQTVPASQRSFVQSGEVRNGMSENAVFLAWGAPNTPHVKGQDGKKSFIKWNYSTQVPINSYNSGPHYYIDGYNRNRDHQLYANNQTSYIPKIYASVTFTNGKVSSWEK